MDDIGIPLAQDTSNVTYGPPTPKAEQVKKKRKYIPVDEEPPINVRPMLVDGSRQQSALRASVVRSGPVQRNNTITSYFGRTGMGRKRTKRTKRKSRVTRKH